MSVPLAREYRIRRKVLTIFGAKFHIFGPDGSVIGFSKQKAFKLKEDIRIYTDESEQNERLIIKARSIVDFSAAYDVIEPGDGSKIGALRRKGLKSILRDTWELLDNEDHVIGNINEDSLLLATIRRWLANFIPQSYALTIPNGTVIATYRQGWNPFVFNLTMTITPGHDEIDPRLILAGGILLAAIEGRE